MYNAGFSDSGKHWARNTFLSGILVLAALSFDECVQLLEEYLMNVGKLAGLEAYKAILTDPAEIDRVTKMIEGVQAEQVELKEQLEDCRHFGGQFNPN